MGVFFIYFAKDHINQYLQIKKNKTFKTVLTMCAYDKEVDHK